MQKLLYFVGPINIRRFVERTWNFLQSGKIDNHLKADPLPDGKHHNRRKGQGCAVKPVVRS